MSSAPCQIQYSCRRRESITERQGGWRYAPNGGRQVWSCMEGRTGHLTARQGVLGHVAGLSLGTVGWGMRDGAADMSTSRYRGGPQGWRYSITEVTAPVGDDERGFGPRPSISYNAGPLGLSLSSLAPSGRHLDQNPVTASGRAHLRDGPRSTGGAHPGGALDELICAVRCFSHRNRHGQPGSLALSRARTATCRSWIRDLLPSPVRMQGGPAGAVFAD